MFGLDEIKYIQKIINTYPIGKVDILNQYGVSVLNQVVDKDFEKGKEELKYYLIELKEDNNLFVKIYNFNDYTEEDCLRFVKILEAILMNLMDTRSSLSISLLDDYLVDVLTRNYPDREFDLTNRANLIHFDVNTPRVPILVDIKYFKTIVQSYDKYNTFDVQKILTQIRQILSASSKSSNEYVVFLYDDKFVLFKTPSDDLEEELLSLNESIKRSTNLSVQYTIGRECSTYEQYYADFQKILKVQEYWGRQQLDQTILYLTDYLIDLVLLDVTKESKDFFNRGVEPALKDALANHKELIDTFIMFFVNNLDTSATAKECFLHKNTIYYRIKKLSDLLERDLFLSFESTKVYIALKMLMQKSM